MSCSGVKLAAEVVVVSKSAGMAVTGHPSVSPARTAWLGPLSPTEETRWWLALFGGF